MWESIASHCNTESIKNFKLELDDGKIWKVSNVRMGWSSQMMDLRKISKSFQCKMNTLLRYLCKILCARINNSFQITFTLCS